MMDPCRRALDTVMRLLVLAAGVRRTASRSCDGQSPLPYAARHALSDVWARSGLAVSRLSCGDRAAGPSADTWAGLAQVAHSEPTCRYSSGS